jgi:hypothetical protein
MHLALRNLLHDLSFLIAIPGLHSIVHVVSWWVIGGRDTQFPSARPRQAGPRGAVSRVGYAIAYLLLDACAVGGTAT